MPYVDKLDALLVEWKISEQKYHAKADLLNQEIKELEEQRDAFRQSAHKLGILIEHTYSAQKNGLI